MFFAYSAVLPPEVVVIGRVTLLHRGLGVVVHPSTTMVGPVTLSQHVTIGVATRHGAVGDGRGRVRLERCFVGPSSSVIAPPDEELTVATSAAIGPNCYVRANVPARARVIASAPSVKIWSD